jgi:hypothetical protein
VVFEQSAAATPLARPSSRTPARLDDTDRGRLLLPAAERLVVEYEDGDAADAPFVWSRGRDLRSFCVVACRLRGQPNSAQRRLKIVPTTRLPRRFPLFRRRFENRVCNRRRSGVKQGNKICLFAGTFYGSDGTRTRDLRRDRPVLVSPALPGMGGDFRRERASSRPGCGDCSAWAAATGALLRDVRGMRSLSHLRTGGMCAGSGNALARARRAPQLRASRQRRSPVASGSTSSATRTCSSSASPRPESLPASRPRRPRGRRPHDSPQRRAGPVATLSLYGHKSEVYALTELIDPAEGRCARPRHP